MLSCQNQEYPETAGKHDPNIVIAPLLDRNEKIRMGPEWDQVQNQYARQKRQLNQDQNDVDAAIKMVLLFTQEARVTGEHGHYYPAAMEILRDLRDRQDSLSQDERFFTLCLEAGVLMSLHQFDQALHSAKEAIQLNPNNAQIYGVLVDANVELGLYDEAVAAADKMVSMRPDLRSYARVSYLRQIHGDLPGAIEAMKLAVSAGFPPYEETAWAKYQLARLFEETKDFETARHIYEQILADRPGYPFAIAALGQLEAQSGNTQRALHLYNEAISAIPEVSFYVEKVHVLLQEGKKEVADSIMEEVFIMLEEDQQSGHNMDLYLAEVYSGVMDDQRQALHYAMQEYLTRPMNIEVNKQLALIYFRLGEVGKAKEHLDVALRTNVYDPELAELKQELRVSI